MSSIVKAQIYDFKQLNHIANKIKQGMAAVVETDTVMGIICKNPKLIYEIKQRDLSKQLVTFVSDNINTNNVKAKQLMKKYWPGQLTIIIDGISYRYPDHPYLIKLLKLTGNLYSSSCNISGYDPIKQTGDAIKIFDNYYDKIIFIRGRERSGCPSTVYDCDNNKVLRQGKINID